MEIFHLTVSLFLAPLAALLFAPAMAGVINRTKAVFAGRKGQPLLQPYFDLLRLFRKGTVYSTTTSWIFRAGPVVVFASTLAATCFIPLVGPHISFRGDVIIFLYLLAMARFFLILLALDTGSPFEGMGASREAFFSAIAEPTLFICLLDIMRAHGAFSLGDALSTTQGAGLVSLLLAAMALFIILLSENARIPFDDPTTHLELTMIHEVMILDSSGPDLALLEYAASVKLWLFSMILAKMLLPLGNLSFAAQAAVLLGCAGLIAVLVGVVESIMARLRLVKVPQLLVSAGAIALLGFFVNVTNVVLR